MMNHLHNQHSPETYIPNIIQASEVVVGDVLSGKRVTSIRLVRRLGVYASITQSGDIIVSNVLVSSYVQLIDDDKKWLMILLGNNPHAVGHFTYFPHRMLCRYNIELCKRYERYTNDYGYSQVSYVIICIASIINYLDGWFIAFILLTTLLGLVYKMKVAYDWITPRYDSF